jgi:hypothetical protein
MATVKAPSLPRVSNDMAKRSKKPEPEPEEKAVIYIEAPLAIKTQLEKLARMNRRSLTGEALMGLEKHLAENGLWPPPEGEGNG